MSKEARSISVKEPASQGAGGSADLPASSRRTSGNVSTLQGAKTDTAKAVPPAMRQYLDQKARVGDAILLFRMGDFYETFYEDAKTIARVLGLTLTARDKNSGSPVPLAGVPYHAADRYIARLVAAGYKVAVSEQLEDPREAKGVVKRDIVRIITPGTLTDENLLDEKSDNFLAAICPTARPWRSGDIGVSGVELASGKFFARMVRPAELIDELARLRPAELLVPESVIDGQDSLIEEIKEQLTLTITPRGAHVFDAHLGERALCEQFGVGTLSGFGFDQFDASLCAAASLLDYLRETQKSALRHLLSIQPLSRDAHVLIDTVTLRSLEIERTMRDPGAPGREGTLLWAMDQTVNPMGARRLRQWLCYPLSAAAEICRRQQAVADLMDAPDRLRMLRDLLGEACDLERIIARLGVGRATPRDMVALGQTLQLLEEMRTAIGAGLKSQKVEKSKNRNEDRSAPPQTANRKPQSEIDLLDELCSPLAGHEALAGELLRAIKDDAPHIVRDGGFIADGYHAELDRLRQIAQQGSRYLAEYQAREIQRTGISSLKVGFNSVFGYYIEITHQHRDKVPAEYVRKQTVRNAERYITDELKRHEHDVLGAADKSKQLEIEIFEEIREKAQKHLASLQIAADAMATLDVIAAFAEIARTRNYCRPEVAEQNAGGLEIVDGRHPVLDLTLAERFVPNDCLLHAMPGDAAHQATSPQPQASLMIITGPNMAGKSTYIRQVALLTLMAHTGSYVPAKSMRWRPVDRIFARVGASDELSRGQSTFMVEMVEAARILNNATPRSLVILDEIGRGTSTYDGLAIAWAMTEHLAQRVGCSALFATHYHELTELAQQLPGVVNFNVAVREQLRPGDAGRGVVFLHKIVPGASDRSYGVHVAAMAGLPRSVVKRSEQVLAELEQRGHRLPAATTVGGTQSDDQLLLFGAVQQETPAWCLVLADRLRSLNLDDTTPLAALGVLHDLRGLIDIEE
jgi:DNA mismatch repair protein MutS